MNAPRENADDRRGLVGCIPTYKIAGAAAAEGMSLEEVAAVAQRFADNMATLAVAVRGARRIRRRARFWPSSATTRWK